MSEEEIIKYFKEVISWYRENTPDRVYALNNKDIEMIQGLLDLYNKEKEKNRQGKMRIVQLENEITARIEDVNKYFISKDKIKELREIDNIDLIQFKIRELLEERN